MADQKPDEEEQPSGPPWRAVVGLLVVVALVGVIWLVMDQLNKAAKIQDCVSSGRTNCAPISTAQ